MNDKGFTLIEMIGVVVILSMLILIAGTTIAGIVKNSKNTLSSTQLDIIESAAQLWVEENYDEMNIPGCTIIMLSELRESGILSNIQKIKEEINLNSSCVKACTQAIGEVDFNYEVFTNDSEVCTNE